MQRQLRAFLAVVTLSFALATVSSGAASSQQQGGTSVDPQPAPAQPQAQPSADQQPTFRAGISFVRVDVIVLDRDGRPLVDLTQDDFEVLEDGKPQQIQSFKLVQLPTTPVPGASPLSAIRTQSDEEVAASQEDARIIAIFLDDYHVRRTNSLKARQALSEFIQNRLQPSDLLALMYPLTPLSEVTLTRNHERIVRAISNFEGRKYDYRPRNQMEERYTFYPAAVVEKVRLQVTMSAMKALAIRLGALREGRKAMVFVSEGFASRLPPQLNDPVSSAPGLGNPNRFDPLAGQTQTPLEQTVDFFAQTELMSDLQELYDTANKNNTAVYAIDPRGLTGQEFDIDENVNITVDNRLLNQSIDTLRVLADNTDGRAIVNQNDLGKGLQQILSDSGTYYLLGYNSSQAPQDGKFHRIDVRVKRPRVNVRARKGYWALTAEEATNALAPARPGPPPAVEAALGTLAATRRDGLIRTWVGMTPAENGKTRVTFVWEPTPASPATPARRGEPARVALLVTGSGGNAYFRGAVPDAAPAASNGAAAGSTAAAPRGPWKATFDVDPGRLQLLMTVQGRSAEVLDRETREVAVPDLTAPEPAVSTPQLFRARTPREWQTVAADANAIPTIVREFSRTERLLLRFGVYGTGAPAPSAKLLNRTGQSMADIAVRPSPLGAPLYQLDVPLGGLAPGEYLIEIMAGDAQQLVAIRVTG
jgi:VWFA-related protein